MPHSNDDDFFLFDLDDLSGFSELFNKIRNQVKKNRTEYVLPYQKKSDAKWIPPGEKIKIGEYRITSGFFYYGTYFPSRWSDNDPSLINPNLPISDSIDTGDDANSSNLPDYSTISPLERKEYLSWLACGRKRADTSETPPLLFLCGLERRVLDSPKDMALTNEEEIAIRDEVYRIMLLYKDDPLVETAYSNFFQYLEIKIDDRRLYEIPVPVFDTPEYDCYYRDIPVYLKIALSQTALDNVPVPAGIAFEWYSQEVEFSKHAPFNNQREKFKALFVMRYRQKFGSGILLKPNKRIIHKYRIGGYSPLTDAINKKFDFKINQNLCDVSTLPSAKKKINNFGLSISDELNRYSRRLSRSTYTPNPSMDFLALPVELWENSVSEKFEKLKTDIKNKCKIIDALSLFRIFTGSDELSKTPFFDLIWALECNNIAVEPDIIAFKTTVKNDDKFILHILKDKIPSNRNNSEYAKAILLTELSASALNACGAPESTVLDLNGVGALGAYFTDRLSCLFKLLLTNPPRFSKLISKLKQYSKPGQMFFVNQIQNFVLVRYKTHYEAVAFLEKLYKALGFSQQELYSTIHNDNGGAGRTNKTETLNRDEIEKLREDSRQISSVIENIFSENDEQWKIEKTKQESLLGLDEAHSSMLVHLAEKKDWKRKEMEALAKQHSLFTDGAIETINEASYNTFDEPLIEEDETNYKMDIALLKKIMGGNKK
ncbi:hypothetical protein FACS1894190_00710 [Spirochaetia bacterium]|nr:hypothetical protein FACS1894190_00710 [Spirochaetia bacterium]